MLHGAWHTVRVGVYDSRTQGSALKSPWIDSRELSRLVERQSGSLASTHAAWEPVHVFSLPAQSMQIRNSLVIKVRAHTLLTASLQL